VPFSHGWEMHWSIVNLLSGSTTNIESIKSTKTS
jgi:hypothetical protein